MVRGVVRLGLALILAGRVYHVEWLRLADPISALFVAGVVVSVSWRLARRTTDALLDAAPAGVRAQIIDAVRGGGWCTRNRPRSHPPRRQSLLRRSCRRLGAYRTFQRSEQLVEAVTAAVRGILPDADVTVQPLPRAQLVGKSSTGFRAVATGHT